MDPMSPGPEEHRYDAARPFDADAAADRQEGEPLAAGADAQARPPQRRLLRGDHERAVGGVRAVDPDEDLLHDLSLL
jgi:hypothetical protein